MRRNVAFSLGLVLLAATLACLVFRDRLPPTTLTDRVRAITDLPVASDALIEQSEVQQGLFASAYVRATLRVSADNFRELDSVAGARGYRHLPVTSKDSAENPVLRPYATPGAAGWYRLEHRKDGYSIVVVDGQKRVVYVQSDGG